MIEETPEVQAEIDTSKLLLIVVGAHLRAEMADRPLAYRLCDRIKDCTINARVPQCGDYRSGDRRATQPCLPAGP